MEVRVNMCGIAGVIQLDKRKTMDKDMCMNAFTLFMELQDRGKSAWGIYLEKAGKYNNKLYCGKKDNKMSGELFKHEGSITDYFLKKDTILHLGHTHTLLLHARQTTQGKSEKNENNHPFNTDNFILAHNGTITNDSYVIKKYNITSDIECDSYVIVALIQKFYDKNGGDIIKAIKDTTKVLTGSYACWLYHKDKGDLYLFRNGTYDIDYFMDEKNGTFIFCSDGDYIEKAFNEPTRVNDDTIKTLDTGKIYKLVKSELKEIGEFNLHARDNSSYYDNRCAGGNRSSLHQTTSNITPINSSLIYLYKLCRKYEDKAIETVVAVVRDNVVIVAKPEGLIKLLDKGGFLQFKHKNVNGTDYHKYTISPKEKVNELVNTLKGAIEDLPMFEATDIVDGDNNSLIEGLRDFAESTGCSLEYKDKHYVFSYATKDEVPKVGFPFGDGNVLKLKDIKYHRRRLGDMLRKAKLWDGEVK